jgi:hypothetical protein
MRLETVWCVFSPEPGDAIVDILFSATPDLFCDWVIGTIRRRGWRTRIASLAIWTIEAEARADAESRLAKRDERSL